MPRGLMLCAPLADTGGKAAFARGAFASDPTLTSSPAMTGAPRGRGLRLTGGTTCVSYLLNAQPPSTWSMEALIWADADTAPGSLCGFNQSADGTNGFCDRGITGGYASSPWWEAYLYDGGDKRSGSGPVTSTLGFLHFVVTADGSNMRLYLNGVLQNTTAVANGGLTSYTLPAYFCIGNTHIGATVAKNSCTVLLVNFADVVWTAAEIQARYLNPFGFLQWPEDRRHQLVGVAAAASAPNWGYELEPAFPRRRKPRPLTLNEDPNWPFTATATPTQFGWATPEQFAKRRRPQTVSWQDVPVFPVSIVSLTPTQFGFGWDPQFPIRRKPRNFQPDEPTDQWPSTATATPTQQGFAWEPQFPIRRKRQVLQPDQPAEMWPFTVTAPTVRVPANAIPPVPERAPAGNWEPWLVQIARTLNLVLRGKVNAVTSMTLTANATSTTLIDDRIGANTFLALVPLTQNATILDLAPYVSARTRGSATIAHGSSPATDLEFSVLLIG